MPEGNVLAASVRPKEVDAVHKRPNRTRDVGFQPGRCTKGGCNTYEGFVFHQMDEDGMTTGEFGGCL